MNRGFDFKLFISTRRANKRANSVTADVGFQTRCCDRLDTTLSQLMSPSGPKPETSPRLQFDWPDSATTVKNTKQPCDFREVDKQNVLRTTSVLQPTERSSALKNYCSVFRLVPSKGASPRH